MLTSAVIEIISQGRDIKMVTFEAAVDELTRVQAFAGHEVLLGGAVLVRVPELDPGQRSASAWVVDNSFYYSFNVSSPFRIVQVPKFGRSKPVHLVGSEDRLLLTLPLSFENGKEYIDLQKAYV